MLSKFIQAFLIGAIASAAAVYFYQKDRQYQIEIDRLNMEMSELRETVVHSPFADSIASQLSDLRQQTEIPKFEDIQSGIWNSRQNAITRAIARTSDAVVGISLHKSSRFRIH
jgi:hypothetical protein